MNFNKFPKNNKEAELLGGFLESENIFCRSFKCDKSIEKTLVEINNCFDNFEIKNVSLNDLDQELSYTNEDDNVSISKHGYLEELVVFITANQNINNTIENLIKFRDERDWEQFHNSKDLALAISIEASELLELFLWKGNEQFDKDKLEDELADIFSYALLLAEKHNLNVSKIVNRKIQRNKEKYPISKAKGTAKKYTDL